MILLGGLAAGAGHALAGPDHLAAVLPLAAGNHRAGWTGLAWGAGHGLGLALVAALGMAARGWFVVEVSERWVGLALVLTGLWALRPRSHAHHHGAALGVGAVHGAAGATHVLVALSAFALPPVLAVGWVAAFTVGSAVAMGAFAVAVQRGARLAGDLRRLRLASAAVAIAVGVLWASTS